MKTLFLFFIVITINMPLAFSQKKDIRTFDLKKVFVSAGKNKKVLVDKFQGDKKMKTDSTVNNKVNVESNHTIVVRTENKDIKKFDPSIYKDLQPINIDSAISNEMNVIPELIVQKSAGTNEFLTYQIGFESKKPLELNDSTGKFEGTIKFFLFSTGDNNSESLNQTIPIEIVSDDIGFINPSKKEIDHLSIPLSEIKLVGTNLSDSAKLKILTRSNPAGYETFIKVKPSIIIESGRNSLQGLGIQKIPISIKIVGSSRNDSVLVNLIGKGTFIPNQLYVKYNMPATVYLRSEGMGEVELEAESSQIKSGMLTMNYVFPWMFILMSFIGGALGSSAKYFTKRNQKFLKTLITGVVIGFLASIVYYVLGYSLNKFEVSDIFNEFAVLGFSAVVAFFGIRKIS